MRRLARLILFLWGLGSAGAFGGVLWWVATDPAAGAWRDATLTEITAAADRMLAATATPAHMAALITARLEQDPRNWLALDALLDTATRNAIPLPADLTARVATLRDADTGTLATVSSCAQCLWDATSCSLTEVFVCQAPVNLTPVGDVVGVTRAATNYAMGDQIDRVDLALSIVGLGATLATLPSGGSSLAVKGGAGLLKTALKMGRVSRPLMAVIERAVRDGVDWARLREARSLDGIRASLRMDQFADVSRIATAMAEVYGKTDMTTALHLLPMVDTAGDAERLAKSAAALGPRLLGHAEVLGKTRLLRATLRVTDVALSLAASFLSLAAALASLAGLAIERTLHRLLRHTAKVTPRPNHR